MNKFPYPVAWFAVYSSLLLVACDCKSDLDDRIVISIVSNDPKVGVTFDVDVPAVVARDHHVTQRFSPVVLECGNASRLTVLRDGSDLVEVLPFCENGEILYRISAGFPVTISTESGDSIDVERFQMERGDSPRVFRLDDEIVHHS